MITLFFRLVLGYFFTRLRNKCTIEVEQAVSAYHHTVIMKACKGKHHTVHFHSYRNVHVLKATPWWLPNLKFCTYRVIADEFCQAIQIKVSEMTFPETVPWFLSGTDYSHMAAIHAFIDEYAQLSA